MQPVYKSLSTAYFHHSSNLLSTNYLKFSHIKMSLQKFFFLTIVACAAANPVSRVVGGKDALPGEFLYQVSLQYFNVATQRYKHFCGGSILNDETIITAAHCDVTKEISGGVKVVAGAHNLNISSGNEQIVNLVKMINHKSYKGSVGPYDIALIKISPKLVLNEFVQPIKLPIPNELATEKLATLSGWGYISTDRSDVRPDILQKADLIILPQSTCFTQLFLSPYHKTNLCAGFSTGLPNACKGDSGGPLAVRSGNEAVLHGIVSWGTYPCGKPYRPGVYTDVAQYIDWINEHIEN